MGNIFFETWFLSSIPFKASKSFHRMIILIYMILMKQDRARYDGQMLSIQVKNK